MRKQRNPLRELIDDYTAYLESSFSVLWGKVTIEADKLDAYSVIGGLLARQVTLSIQLARAPSAWNGHAAPLFLRAMTDLQITLAWIMRDMTDRSRKYILHGLGEEKLLVEHHKKELQEHPDSPNAEKIQKMIEIKSAWINSQRHEFMVEVNLGHWAQLDYRTMAQEAECEGLYRFAYKPFSVAAHNMWPHVSTYNSRACGNPLHRHHLVPALREFEMEPDFLYRSCKYVHQAYELFVSRFDIDLGVKMPLEWWDSYFEREGTGEQQASRSLAPSAKRVRKAAATRGARRAKRKKK